jgi:hypothetical protein
MPCHLPAAPGRPCRPSLTAHAATGGESLDGPEGHAGASGPWAARDGVLDQARADVGHPRPIDPDHARAGGLAPCHICAGTGAHCCHICSGGLGSLPHLRRDWGSPLPHLRRDSAHPSHICTGTRLTAVSSATSLLGLGSPVPHLQFFELILRLSHEKYSKLNALTKCLTQVGQPRHICTGTGTNPTTFAPGLGPNPQHRHRDWGSPLPHWHRDWGSLLPHLHRTALAAAAPTRAWRSASTSTFCR